MLEFPALDASFMFIGATFVASVIAGVAGFAFGLIAAGIWLHILTPLQTALLIVVCGMIVQGLAVWKLRRALRLAQLWPFLIGGAIGVPIGAELLRLASPHSVRVGVGLFLVAFSVYSLARPKIAVPDAGRLGDGGVGLLSGVLGGATGLGGILPTIWCNLRGLPKDQQRMIFQPVAVGIHAMVIAWIGGTGAIGGDIIGLVILAIPALLLGTWLGLRLYGRLDEAGFRRVVLALLLASGVALLF